MTEQNIGRAMDAQPKHVKGANSRVAPQAASR